MHRLTILSTISEAKAHFGLFLTIFVMIFYIATITLSIRNQSYTPLHDVEPQHLRQVGNGDIAGVINNVPENQTLDKFLQLRKENVHLFDRSVIPFRKGNYTDSQTLCNLGHYSTMSCDDLIRHWYVKNYAVSRDV